MHGIYLLSGDKTSRTATRLQDKR